MAITQRYLNMDQYFRTTDGDKIILNDMSYFNKDDWNLVNLVLKSVYNVTECISTKPACDCGKLEGSFNLGKVCKICSTKCKEPHEKIKPILWLKAIDSNIKFINPMLWIQITRMLDSKLDYMRYFCDTRYNPPKEVPLVVQGILRDVLKEERTYQNTMANLHNILIYLANHSTFKDKDKQTKIRLLIDYYTKYNEDLFSNYLPIINKRLFVVENTPKGIFVNPTNANIEDVVKSWLKICSETNVSSRRLSNVMGSTMSGLCTLYLKYFKDFVASKTGMFRKHVYGARSHFTFRCIIVSVEGPHEHDAITVPWIVGLTAFRPHVLNKLIKRGYNYRQASNLIFKSVKIFNQEIYDILEELIKEAPDGKIYVQSHRNPSLKQGSSIRVWIKAFNKDPMDYSVKLSALIAKPSNADYDGDELNHIMLLDNNLAEEFATMDVCYSAPDVGKPYSISGNLGMLSPATSLLSSYLSDKSTNKEEYIDSGIASKLGI